MTYSIKVRRYGDSSIATVIGHKVKASCTMGDKWAAERAAKKFLKDQAFELIEIEHHLGGSIWGARVI